MNLCIHAVFLDLHVFIGLSLAMSLEANGLHNLLHAAVVTKGTSSPPSNHTSECAFTNVPLVTQVINHNNLTSERAFTYMPLTTQVNVHMCIHKYAPIIDFQTYGAQLS